MQENSWRIFRKTCSHIPMGRKVDVTEIRKIGDNRWKRGKTICEHSKIMKRVLKFQTSSYDCLTHSIPVNRICATTNEIHRGCSFRQIDLHSSVAILLWSSEKRVWKRECTVLWYQRIAWPKTVDSDERHAQRYYFTEGNSYGATCPLNWARDMSSRSCTWRPLPIYLWIACFMFNTTFT